MKDVSAFDVRDLYCSVSDSNLRKTLFYRVQKQSVRTLIFETQLSRLY